MNRRGFFLCAGALALAGCATPPGAPTPAGRPPPVAEPAGLEAVYAVTAAREGLTVRVASNGCTAKADFVFYVERKGLSPTLSVARRRLDTCRSFAAGHADLVFTWAELGLAPNADFVLLNPLTAQPGP